MHDFAYTRASDLQQALSRLSATDTAVISGGTELLNWMRLGIAEPEHVVDIGALPELGRVEQQGSHLTIGALSTLNAVGEHPLVVQHATVLVQACLLAASAQVRNRATLGGNVLQKTRCAYFRTETPVPWACNKRVPGTGCAARQGINERHALFGWTDDCIAVQPSDPAVALACLDAEAEVASARGRRFIPMTQFHVTQEEAAAAGEDAATFETRLARDEVIVSYRIPIRPAARSAYLKVRERASYEYALVSAAASIELEGDRISAARIALGSVAQKPWRLPQAEGALVGKPLQKEALVPIIEAAMRDACPLAQNGYKVEMARNAAVRALLMAGGKA